MKALLTAVTLAALTGPVLVQTAAAQSQATCRPRQEVVQVLEDTYEESRRAYALIDPTQMLELFAAESGSWTALVTRADGVSCLVASGTAWTEADAEAAGSGG